MAGLLRLVEPFELGNGFRRAEIHRLVEDQPAGNRPAFGFAWFGHASLLLLVVVVAVEIAAHLGRTQELVDLLVIVEAGIVAETHFRHVFHLPELRPEPAADELRMAVQSLDDDAVVGNAERRHVSRGDLQVRRHAHFRN
ncbi:hypothetical protein RHECNPAF_470082 [Rhizobium etli CNPAF512]|nr:hypothetical protein RHECNPAF_470082 [Rhizobium etli CNPAF512]